MANINVSELITDPDFSTTFKIIRHFEGKFVDGIYQDNVTEINLTGIVQPYEAETAQYTPNGDVITGDIKVWALQQIFTTREKTDNSGTSDIIVYKNEQYKVNYSKNWEDNGYWSAIAKRLELI